MTFFLDYVQIYFLGMLTQESLMGLVHRRHTYIICISIY